MSKFKPEMETDPAFIEELITRYGEPYRRLITDSLRWLDSAEPTWGLDEPINREEFIEGLLERAKVQ